MDQFNNPNPSEVEETPAPPQWPPRRRAHNSQPSRPNYLWILIGVLAVALVVLAIVAIAGANRPVDPTTQPSSSSTAASLQLHLLGECAATLEFGTVFADPGTQVIYQGNTVDAQVEVTMPQIPSVGRYTIVYTVHHAGLTATAERVLEVVDTTAPVITLLEVPGYCPEYGDIYEEEGYTALDAHDGDLTDRVTRVIAGDLISYSVTDAAGNTATVTRTIEYGDAVAPQITLLGGSEVTIMAGTEFEDPGYTAEDNVDGDLTAHVTVSGNYNKYLPGSYTYTYTVTDAHGNTATVERILIVQGMVQPDTVTPDGKVIYLTFDDGPHSRYTAELLEVLEKYNVKATFFVVGTMSLGYLDDIAAGGHAIGIHSYTHDFYDIYASEEAFFADFYKLYEAIYDRTGIYTTLCRFPGGSSNTISRFNPGIMTRLTAAVEALGFQYFDWNVDSNDAGGAKTADEVYEKVIAGISKRNVSVVLQHDIKGFSVEAVERIIQWGLANGYTFLPLDSSSPTCHHSVNN